MGSPWATELDILLYLRQNKAARQQIITLIGNAGIVETKIFFITHPYLQEPLVLPESGREHHLREVVNTRLNTIAGIRGITYKDLLKELGLAE